MQNKPNQNKEHTNNATSPAARHNARRYALQAMYQWQLAGTALEIIEAEFLRFHIDKKFDLEYFKELIHGVPEQKTDLDKEIREFTARPLAEIDPVELAVLRISIYEILRRPDVPYRVIINEALELTKKFGSVEGYKFVNGILDKIARKNRKTEMDMGKT
jgi:N utilization substance protein B